MHKYIPKCARKKEIKVYFYRMHFCYICYKMLNMAIKIICDAVSNLFKSIVKDKNLDVKVMNVKVNIGNKEYNCYDDDLDVENFQNIIMK